MVFSKKNNYWWTSLLTGILAILAGIIVLFHPMIGLSILSVLFIIFFFICGSIEITIGTKSNSIGSIVNGVINICFAVILLILPTPESINLFIFYIGFYILLQSLIGLLTGMKLNKNITKNGSPLIIISVIGILLALIILTKPDFFASFITVVFALGFICYGIYKIFFSINIK